MSDHPGLEPLAALALDELPAAERVELETHLVACESCRSTRARLERLVKLAGEALASEPPASVYERALGIHRSGDGDELLVAELIEDTHALVGVRDEGTVGAEGRILIYRVRDVDVHVQVLSIEQGKRSRFLGQIFGRGDAGLSGAAIRIVREGSVLAESVTDELGEFHVTTMADPHAWIEVHSKGLRFRTPPIRGPRER